MGLSNIVPDWPLTTALVIILIFYIFLHTLRSHRSSVTVPKLPPCPPKLPVIGNLHQILGKPRHKSLWELSKKYGPVMRIYIGSKQFLVLSSPEMAKEILKTQDHIFCSREFFHTTKRLTYNFVDVAFSPHSSHWREMRKILVSEFVGPRKTKLSRHVLVTEMESIIRSLSLHPLNTEESKKSKELRRSISFLYSPSVENHTSLPIYYMS